MRRTKTLNGETKIDENFHPEIDGTAANNWTAEWKQCAAKAPDGGVFEYYIEENTVDYYTVADVSEEKENTKQYTFTNTYIPEKRKITAYKNWEDLSDGFQTRPTTIKYQLWCRYDLYKEQENGGVKTFVADKDSSDNIKSFNDLVYDPDESDDTKQSAVYKAMFEADPTLTGDKAKNYFERILDTNSKVGSDNNCWKVEFDNLPYKVNGLADNQWAGYSVDVTYYIMEVVDDTTKTLYKCPDNADSQKSNEEVLLKYGQPFSDEKTATAGTFTIPKSWSLNGVQSFEIPDLQSADIFGNQYSYYVKETSNSGGVVKTEDSPFHDNSNGKTTVLVTNELPKLYFKIQRNIDPKADPQTVKNLELTINGNKYQSDINGLFAVPKTYVENEGTTTISPFVITGLPEKTEDDVPATEKRTYTYSVLECDANGDALSGIADADKLQMTKSGSGSVSLTITKPLGIESPNTAYQLFRKVKGKDYNYIVTDNSDNQIKDVTVKKSEAVDNKIDLLITTPATETPAEYIFKVRKTSDGTTYSDVTNITAVNNADAEQTFELDSSNMLTIPKNTSVLIKGLDAAENDGAEEQVTSIVYEKCIAAEKDAVKYPADENGTITIPESSVRRRNIVVTVPNLPKYYNDGGVQKEYTYSVKECTSSTDKTELAENSRTISFSKADSNSDTVTLTVKSIAPVLYFRVFKNGIALTTVTATMNGSNLTVSDGIITAEEKNMIFSAKVNDLPKASENSPYGYSISNTTDGLTMSATETSGKVSLDVSKTFANVYYRIFDSKGVVITSLNGRRLQALVGSEKITATPDGTLIVSKFFANNNKLSVRIPGLDAGTDYTVKEYTTENGDGEQTVTYTSETEDEIKTILIQKTGITTVDNLSFKVNQNSTVINKIVTADNPLKAKKFLVSDEEITGEGVLTASADNILSITNTLETRDISMALNWDDQGYGYNTTNNTTTNTKKTENMHYPVTAGLTSVNEGNAKATVTTKKPSGTYVGKKYYSGENGIIKVPYSEHYVVSGENDNVQYDGEKFTVDNSKAVSIGENKKAFYVLFTGLDAKGSTNENKDYTYKVEGAAVYVRPSAEGKVDILVEKTIENSNNTYNFEFNLKRSSDDENWTNVIESATIPTMTIMDLNVALPPVPTAPYVTYTYTYDMIQCDKDGNEIDSNFVDYRNSRCKTFIIGDALSDKYLYYKATVKAEMEAKKVITMTHGKSGTKKLIDITLNTVSGEDGLTFTLKRKLDGSDEYVEVPGYSSVTLNNTLTITELDAGVTNSSNEFKSYEYKAFKSDGAEYDSSEITIAAGTSYDTPTMEYSTHYGNYNYAVGNGVRFENMPIYNSSGSIMNYSAYESPLENFSNLTEKQVAEINDYQIYGLYDTVKNDAEKTHEIYQTSGSVVGENAGEGEGKDATYLSDSDTDSYFFFKSNGTYTRHYLYQGTAQAYKKISTSKKDMTKAASVADIVTHINMLNTLPLTSVKVKKHWDDHSNEFNLRPSDFQDVNKDGPSSDNNHLDLTIKRELSNASDTSANSNGWAIINYTTGADHETEWYTTEEAKPVENDTDEWTFTYKKLLRGNNENVPYIFKIEETKLNSYYEPQYCASYNATEPVNDKQIITEVDGGSLDGETPLSQTFEITNKLETIDVVVAKSWEDNDYDSSKTDNLHYNVQATLSSADLTMSEDSTRKNATSGKYEDSKVIAKTKGNGVKFTNLPRYKQDGTAIVYKVQEYATNDDATAANTTTGEVGQLSSQYHSNTGTDTTSETFAVGSKRYGYVGTCKLETDTNGNMQFNILNTLPLTAVKVNKHWLDQNNEFEIRPTVIKDVNKNETFASGTYSLDLTLYKKSGTGSWTKLAPNKSTVYTDSYTGTKSYSNADKNNEWSYTYTKLLMYDLNNNVYSFKIEEARVTGYCTPQYCVEGDYEKAAKNQTYTNMQSITKDTDLTKLPIASGASWNGETPLDTTMEITNKLDTREIKVYKDWVDSGLTDTHYDIDFTLSSTQTNNGNANTAASGETPAHTRNYSGTYKEVLTLTTNAEDKFVTFTNLPKYDKNGAVIVYNVREDANEKNSTPAADQTPTMTQKTGTSTTLTTVPTFTDGDRHYGYTGTAEYVAQNSASGNYATEYHITNTLPVRTFTARKVWDDDNNRDNARPASLTFTLRTKAETPSDSDWDNQATSDVQYTTDSNTCWKATFSNYPSCDYSNNVYKYNIIESDVSNYTLISSGHDVNIEEYVFTNQHPITENKFTVKKIWNDGAYKDIVRPDESKVEVQLWCTFLNAAGTGYVDKQVSLDEATDNTAIKSYIQSKDSSYKYDQKISQFDVVYDDNTTTGYNENLYERTYVFDHLPAYVHLDSTATYNGTEEKWYAVNYYVKEVFTEKDYIYSTSYSADGSTYVSTPSGATGTTLLDGNKNPTDTNVIYVKNTPVTRNILVTKDWDDNGYGVESGNAKVSELSKTLHYAKTAIRLTGTTVLSGSESTQVYDSTMYLAKENTDPTDTTNYKGVLFKDVPIYDKNGEVITYKVTESEDTDGTHIAATGTDLKAPESTDTFRPCKKSQSP